MGSKGCKWSEEAKKEHGKRMVKYWAEHPESTTKGLKWSEEAKKKQSESKKRYFKEHPEMKKAISERATGLKWSKERRERHRKIMKEVANRPELKERQRKARNRPEVKKHHSESVKKAWESLEARQKQSEKMKEVCNRPKERERNSKAQKKRRQEECPEVRKLHNERIREAMNRPEVRERRREIAKEIIKRPGVREAISKSMKEVWSNPETRKVQCEERKRRWEKISPEERKKYMLRASKAIKFVSKGEAALYELIHQHYPTAKNSQWIVGYQADIVLAEHKINVEYDGIYWHQNPKKDEARDKFLQKLGWTVLRVREKEQFDINILHNLVAEKKSNVA